MRNKPRKPYQKSSRTTQTHTYPVNVTGELLSFLLQHLTKLSRNAVKSILARGQVTVDGRVETAYNYVLQPGHMVAIHPNQTTDRSPLIGLSIVHEDDDLIIVHKEAGLLSVAASPEDDTAYRQLTAYVRLSHPQNRIFIVHRLDRDTSGIMMFAKREAIQQHLQNNWTEVVKQRVYLALVEGKVAKSADTITSWLKENKSLMMYSSRNEGDGQLAVTRYKVLQTNPHYSLLEVELDTGRKNQIRVHMQDIGHPVVGDKKYGSRKSTIGRLGLHAYSLSFVHPTSDELLHFESAIPKEFQKMFHLGVQSKP